MHDEAAAAPVLALEDLLATVQASERAVSAVVEEISLWQPGGLPFQLHLIYVALLPPESSRTEEDVHEEVR